MVTKTEEEYSEDGHYINYYYKYQHDKVPGHNRVIVSWYINNATGEDKTKNILGLHTADTALYDSLTRERVTFLGYSNIEITPKFAFIGRTKPIYVIQPEYGGHVILNVDDLQKVVEENDIRTAKLVAEGYVPKDLNLPPSIDLSNYR